MNRNDVPTQQLILSVASQLQAHKSVQPPAWASFVKTGVSRERPPSQENWWYLRSASVLHKIDKFGPVGTQKLRVQYGSRQNRGYKPEAFRPASGNIVRKILQQLEASQLIKQVDKEGRKGRVLTPQGNSLLDKAAKQVHNGAQ